MKESFTNEQIVSALRLAEADVPGAGVFDAFLVGLTATPGKQTLGFFNQNLVMELEIVFFMRDVLRSNYFKQRKGRGCRVISPTKLQNGSPDATNKERCVITDAVGVTDWVHKDSAPLDRQPGIPLNTVLQAIGAGSRGPNVVSTFARRLSRLDKIIGDGVRKQIEAKAGAPMSELIGKMVTDLVSLVRFALHQETILRPFAETVNGRFEAWLASPTANRQPPTANSSRFTAEQMKWLMMIRDHIAGNVQIERDAFEYVPLMQEGGLGKAYEVFGEQLEPLMKELNEVLAA